MRDPEQRRERCCSAALRALSFAGDFLSCRVEALQVLYWEYWMCSWLEFRSRARLSFGGAAVV